MKSLVTMKLLNLLIIVLGLTLAGSSGCSKKLAVDTVKLEYSFQGADPATQTTVTEAVESIDKADYSGALEKLKKVSGDPKLTAEQKTAVSGVMAQIQNN